MGGDTVVVITPEHVKKINVVKVERDNYKELSDTLESTLNVCLWNDSTKTLEIKSKNKQIQLLNTIIKNDTLIINKLEESNDLLKDELSDEKRKKLFYQITSSISSVAIIILTVLLLK